MTFLSAVAAASLWAPRALAQACCAGGSAVTPARLELHEDYAVGMQLHATDDTGAFLSDRSYAANPAGASEYDFEDDLFATARFLRRGQATLLVPAIGTYRAETGIPSFGGGIGDLNLSGRWDFIEAAESRYVPGIALLAGVTFPTGRPPDAPSASLWSANATGIGAFQITAGIAIEKVVGDHLLLNVTGLLSQRLPRSVSEGGVTVDETLGLQLFAIAAVGWVFENDFALALSGTYTGEQDALVDGQRVPQSGRAQTTVGVSASAPLGQDWRVQGSLFDELQISGLGANQPIGVGLTFTVLRTWS
ncbi:MAG: hypothetical protein ACYDCL_15390 [Myxococcales bacterium]